MTLTYPITEAEASLPDTDTVFTPTDTEIRDILQLIAQIPRLTIREEAAEAVEDARVHVLALVQAEDAQDAARRILPR